MALWSAAARRLNSLRLSLPNTESARKFSAPVTTPNRILGSLKPPGAHSDSDEVRSARSLLAAWQSPHSFAACVKRLHGGMAVGADEFPQLDGLAARQRRADAEEA